MEKSLQNDLEKKFDKLYTFQNLTITIDTLFLNRKNSKGKYKKLLENKRNNHINIELSINKMLKIIVPVQMLKAMLINKVQKTTKVAILNGIEQLNLEALFNFNENEIPIPIKKEFFLNTSEITLNTKDFGISLKIEKNIDELGIDGICNNYMNNFIENENKDKKLFQNLIKNHKIKTNEIFMIIKDAYSVIAIVDENEEKNAYQNFKEGLQKMFSCEGIEKFFNLIDELKDQALKIKSKQNKA